MSLEKKLNNAAKVLGPGLRTGLDLATNVAPKALRRLGTSLNLVQPRWKKARLPVTLGVLAILAATGIAYVLTRQAELEPARVPESL